MIEDIIDAYDKSLTNIIVLLDYSRAFDTLDHRLLYFEYYGFDANAVDLVESFLSNGHQKVHGGDKYSEKMDFFKI